VRADAEAAAFAAAERAWQAASRVGWQTSGVNAQSAATCAHSRRAYSWQN
jgi:hypothetical protein